MSEILDFQEKFFDSHLPVVKFLIEPEVVKLIRSKFRNYKFGKWYNLGDLDCIGRIQLIVKKDINEISCEACTKFLRNNLKCMGVRNIDSVDCGIVHQDKNLHFISIDGSCATINCFISGREVDEIYDLHRDHMKKYMRLSESIDLTENEKSNYMKDIGLNPNSIEEERKKIKNVFLKIVDEIRSGQIMDRKREIKEQDCDNGEDEEEETPKTGTELKREIKETLQEFIEEFCLEDEGLKTKSSRLANEYNLWRKNREKGITDVSYKQMKEFMTQMGYEYKRKNDGHYYIGICLKSECEEEYEKIRKKQGENDEKQKKREKLRTISTYKSLEKFMDERCIKGEKECVRTGDFVREYKSWRCNNHYPPLSDAAKKIKHCLDEDFGIIHRHKANGPYYLEISLKSDSIILEHLRKFIKDCCMENTNEKIHLIPLEITYEKWVEENCLKLEEDARKMLKRYLPRLEHNCKRTEEGHIFINLITKDESVNNFIGEKCERDDDKEILLEDLKDAYMLYLRTKESRFKGDIDKFLREKFDGSRYKYKKRNEKEYIQGLDLRKSPSKKKKKKVIEKDPESEENSSDESE